MIELAEAQARLFALRSPVETVDVPLGEAVGRWLASDLFAQRTQPARHLSAMDGFAICHQDGAGRWTIIGESAAGRPFEGRVGSGEAVRIFTGAIIPDGADTILIQENAIREGNGLHLNAALPQAGQHVRHAGSDFAKGERLRSAGQPVTAAVIGLAAMAGHATLPVRRPVRIAIISTGDELVPPGEPTKDSQIPSANAPMLAAMLSALSVIIDDQGIVADDLGALTRTLARLGDADIIVTIGGASVGDHDLVRPALEAAGAVLDFWKIAMRPGKPVMAGRLGPSVVLGLPGNPVSAYVTAFLLLAPFIAHLSGADDPLPQRIEANLGAPLPPNGGRLDHIRGRLEGGVAVPLGADDSSMLAALSASNILIIRDIDAEALQSGDRVNCYRIA